MTRFRPSYPLYLANRPEAGIPAKIDVIDKATGERLTQVAAADAKLIDRAIESAVRAQAPMRKLASHQRRAILSHCVKRIEERAEELTWILCREAGKPIRDARGEVTRLVDTFRVGAEEAVRIEGGQLPLDLTSRGEGYFGMWKRVPIGVCSFITPFNFPLNLAAHKIAPAIAAGCPFVLKPATKTPVSALLLGEILAETDLPAGAFSILPCPREGAELFTTDERFKLLSFTGSALVGWDLKARAGKKKVVLELGGNAACIVDETADLEDAAKRITLGAFYQSGQSCISVQRILIHESVYDDLSARLVKAAQGLKSGDPSDETVSIGPLIDEKDAKRLEQWIGSAEKKGARILCGGKRKGAWLEPTYLENVPMTEKIVAEEAFGPVAVISKFREFEKAIEEVNASRYGLQAGVFTKNYQRALLAFDRLEVGGVLIGESPAWRVDSMPYGGVKDSGLGREGVRFAIEDMTEPRLLVMRMG